MKKKELVKNKKNKVEGKKRRILKRTGRNKKNIRKES
jgi:hypothetical protein